MSPACYDYDTWIFCYHDVYIFKLYYSGMNECAMWRHNFRKSADLCALGKLPLL